MSNKNNLIEKFKKLEDELISLLKIQPVEFDENSSKAAVKKEINGYIKKVKKAKAVFAEYELVAEEIKKASKKEDVLAEDVIELREEMEVSNDNSDKKSKSSKTSKSENEYEAVTLSDGKTVKSVYKKKNEKRASKEF